MAAFRKNPLPLGHKPLGQQKVRGMPRRTVPVAPTDIGGFRGRRMFVDGPTATHFQFNPQDPSYGTFNTQGRRSFGP